MSGSCPAGRQRREGGHTLVEILIALLVTGVVVAGLYRSFTTIQRWWLDAGARSDMSQNARAGLETVTRDLEMTGYQTTNYGDAAHKKGLAITLAETGRIEVDEQRPDPATITSATPAYQPRIVFYHLREDAATGRQNLYRQVRTEPGLPAADEIVAEDIAAFTLDYFGYGDPADPKNNNYALNALLPAQYQAGIAPPDVLKNIRRIKVTLSTTPPYVLRNADGTPVTTPDGRCIDKNSRMAVRCSSTLTANVMPQNLMASEVIGDSVPPAVPTGLAAIDTRSCTNKLQVKWNRNSEPDLAGYVLFYGATDHLTVPVSGLADRNNPQVSLKPDTLLITKNADRTTAPNTYPIEVAAYDSSGNYSARSVAVSGNPNPDVTAFGGANDTTVNPAKPSRPASITVTAPTGANGQLAISWQPPGDGSATVGYRLYRSTTPFTAGAHIADTLAIADETTLTKLVTTYADSGLIGCTTYYYAVASVNCDETLVATYVYNPSGTSDYAAGSGQWRDTTIPPAPSLAGSRAGWRRAFVTLLNPTTEAVPDFSRTEIWFSKAPAAPPVLDTTTGVVSGGARIPDNDNGVAGTFTRPGSQVIVFDSETLVAPATPSLDNMGRYSLLAVSYDRCGNASPPAAQSVALIDLCGDDPPGPPPSSPGSPTSTSCQPDTVVLGWQYPPKDDPALYDFAGYHIWRSGPSGGMVELTAGPTWLESWTDSGTLQDGGIYNYTIRATDCVYENQNAAYPNNYSLPLIVGPICPGRMQLFVPPSGGDPLAAGNFVTTVSDPGQPYTYHNNVKLSLQNTSVGHMTIRKMAVSWENPNVVLDSVAIGGGASTTTLQTVSAGGAASGGVFSLYAPVTDRALGMGTPSVAVPLSLRFMTPNGTVNRLTDMRGETLTLSLWVDNDTLQVSNCVDPDLVVVHVPRGPVLGAFSQDSPGEFGIESYAVPGAAGTARDNDVVVPGGVPVNVFGVAFDNSRDISPTGANLGFSQLKLVGVTAAAAEVGVTPAMPAVSFPVASPAFERPLQPLGGNRYAIYRTSPTIAGSQMPVVSQQTNWYYALAVDATGNWDRVPDPDVGAYAYYQEASLPPTPKAPVLRIAATAGTRPALDQATLTWTAPTQYTTGAAIPGTDTLHYDLLTSTTGSLPFTLLAADLAGTSYSLTADLLASTNYYAVVAKTSGPPPGTSAYSNIVRECLGDTTSVCALFRVPASAGYYRPVTVSVDSACAFLGNGAADSVTIRVKKAPTTSASDRLKDFTVAETAPDTGAFTKDITFLDAGTAGANDVVAPSSPVYLQLIAGATTCPDVALNLTGASCSTIPGAPSPVNVTWSASRTAQVDWTAPFDTSDIVGYEVQYRYRACTTGSESRCNGWGNWNSWTSTTAVSAPATSTTFTGLDVGNRGVAQYEFRVRAKDSCPTPNYSTWATSASVQIGQ
jgi:Tfp pilus assembly protein PilE